MSLHVEIRGQGPDLVLLHGWGLNGQVWGAAADILAATHRLHLVDLPGHGRSDSIAPYDLDGLAAAVAPHLPARCAMLGWSLGGMVASRLAHARPGQIEKLILVASNACFRQRPDWPAAMAPAVLDQFASQLERDYRATVQRFLALQAQGGEGAREVVRNLRQRLQEHGEPRLEALRGGLKLLAQEDLRREQAALSQPTLLIFGRNDTLAPVAAGEAMAAQMRHARLEVIAHAAHAPFISHTEVFIASVNAFLSQS